MFEIVLVRHGEPDWEPGGQAVDMPGLTALGHAQAAAVARTLAGERFDAFYVSTLLRARQTAEPIAQALAMEPRQRSWLAELGLPSLEGRTASEVASFFEQARVRDLESWWEGLPGGESFRHFYERVSAGVESLLVGDHRVRIHEDGPHRLWRISDEPRRVLIVAHEGTNAVILSHLLGIEPVPWAWMRFSSQLAGISRVRTGPISSGHVWVLSSFSRTDHLDGVTG